MIGNYLEFGIWILEFQPLSGSGYAGLGIDFFYGMFNDGFVANSQESGKWIREREARSVSFIFALTAL